MVEEKFLEYKNISIEIISKIKKDEDAESLMDKREEAIKEAVALSENKETLREIYLRLEIDKIDRELKEVLSDEIRKTKKELNEVKSRKVASRGYAATTRASSFFSTKI